MKKLLTIAVIILAVSGLTQATTIVKYDFGPNYIDRTLDASIVADHITASNFNYPGDGTTAFIDHSGNGQGYQAYGHWPHDNYSLECFCFAVTIESGWSLDLDVQSIWFDANTSDMSGPNLGKVTYLSGDSETILIEDLEIGGSSWWTYKTYLTPPLTGLTGDVRFRIYGKDATNGGSFSIDNVILNGTVNPIPEPTTICLLGLGALSLIRTKK